MNPRVSALLAVTGLIVLALAILGSALQIFRPSPYGTGATAVAAATSASPSAPTPAAKPVVAVTSGKSGLFQPPPMDAMPKDEFGDMVRLGYQIFEDPAHYAKPYVGNRLACSSCHLDAGRLANSAPMWAAYVAYPAYRSKNKHVNTFEERLQGCFRFSMNGKAPPLGDKVLVALESYSFWLAKGAPTGENLPGRGYPKLPKPAQKPDYDRGEVVYQQKCALCHGPDGQGQMAAGKTVFPPLWGPDSFNWGAGMHNLKNASGFIKANMPLGLGGTLTDQEAWDVAMYIDSHERPQDPRFTGSVRQTRKKYHDSPYSMYGRAVNGHLLGRGSVPPPDRR